RLYSFCVKADLTRECAFVVLFFFFFQAEDGIRDRNVTGVQTCALPISGRHVRLCGLAYDPRSWGKAAEANMAARVQHACEDLLRSEERRVGKEGRARWAAEQ